MLQYDRPSTSSDVAATLQGNSTISASTLGALTSILGLTGPSTTINVGLFDGTKITGTGPAPTLVLSSIPGAAGETVVVVLPAEVLNGSKGYVFDSEANLTINFNTVERVIAMGQGNDTVTVGGDKNTTLDGGPGNDLLTTTGGNDTITGGTGNDTVKSGAGDDTVVAGSGSDTIDGGSGFDTVSLPGTLLDYNASKSGTTLVLTGKSGGAVTTVSNTEFVQLAAGSIAVVASEQEATALRLYQGLFDRSPDAGGAKFWANLVATGTVSLTQAAAGFMNSQEYQTTHAGMSDEAFIRMLYQNGLGRSAEPDGVSFYLKALASGVSRATVAVNIVGSPEAGTAITDVQHLPGTL